MTTAHGQTAGGAATSATGAVFFLGDFAAVFLTVFFAFGAAVFLTAVFLTAAFGTAVFLTAVFFTAAFDAVGFDDEDRPAAYFSTCRYVPFRTAVGESKKVLSVD